MKDIKEIYKLSESIKAGVKDAEHYNTGLVGEALIVSSYKQMTIDNLRKMQFIIGKIIKQKIELERIRNATHTNQTEQAAAKK